VRKAHPKSRQAESGASCAAEPRCGCKGKILEGKEKCYSREHTYDKNAKQPLADVEHVLVAGWKIKPATFP